MVAGETGGVKRHEAPHYYGPRNPDSESHDRAEQEAERIEDDFLAGKLDHEFGVWVCQHIEDETLQRILIERLGCATEWRMDDSGTWELWGRLWLRGDPWCLLRPRDIGRLFRESPRYSDMREDFLRHLIEED